MINMKVISAFAFALAMAGTSLAADEEVIGKYGSITVKKIHGEAKRNSWETKSDKVVAYIDDSSDEVPVISEDVQVDSVYYSRVFKNNVRSTIMLPFSVPTWKLQSFGVYSFVSLKKDQYNNTQYNVYVQEYSNTLEANTPYIVISTKPEDNVISFSIENSGINKVTFNTTTNSQRKTFQNDDGYNWEIIGTYERIDFKNPKGVYGFAAKEKDDGTKLGDFKRATCSEKSCAYIKPFRAFLRCTLPAAIKGLAKSADDAVSLDNLPETVEVRVINADSSTTSLGKLNTYTGEFVSNDNRWYDMKGRLLQHKPTAKGTYFHNRKKVVIK